MPSSELSALQAVLRFLIELAALVMWCIAGWNITDSSLRWMLAIALPLACAVVWGTFRVPGDASASGEAPIPVPGIVRLLLELDVLFGAAVAGAVFWKPFPAAVLAVATVGHYAATTSRVRWLLAHRSTRHT